jgi:HEAT repeat protein
VPVSTEDFNPTLYSLDPHEMEAVQAEVGAEMARDLRGEVLAALFDRVEEPRFPERQREILEIFAVLIPNLLSRGALGAAGSILEELARLLKAEGALKPEQVAQAEQILDEVSGTPALRELIQALEDGTISPDPGELGSLLRHLRSSALAPLLRAAEEAGERTVKTVLREGVRGIALRHREALLRCLDSSDPVVVAGALGLAGRTQAAEAGPRLVSLLSHEEPRVRLAAVEAAVGLRASPAAGALQDALQDAERDVRIAAARALGSLRYHPSAPYFRAILEGKAIRQADISEQIAFFESYGLLQDPEGARFLDGLLNGRGFFGRKETAEIRACAALALGKMGTEEARTALAKAQADTDAVVRSAVSRAMRGEG